MGTASFTKETTIQSGPYAGQFGEYILDKWRVVRGRLVLSNSYATGGDDLDPADAGLTELVFILVDPAMIDENQSGLSVELDLSNDPPTVLAYDGDGSEVSATTDLSAFNPIPVWLVGFN